jgi:hypothetical protein
MDVAVMAMVMRVTGDGIAVATVIMVTGTADGMVSATPATWPT